MASGCSFGLRGPSPRQDPARPPQCSTSLGGAGGADLVGGLFWGIAAVGSFAYAVEAAGPVQIEREAEPGPFIAAGTLFAALSAVHWIAIASGSSKVRACTAAHEQYRERQPPSESP